MLPRVILIIGLLMIVSSLGLLSFGVTSRPPTANSSRELVVSKAEESEASVAPGTGAAQIAKLNARNVQLSFNSEGENAPTLILRNSQTSEVIGALPEYYLVWEDLIRRCWKSIATSSQFNNVGLTSNSDTELDYDVRGSRRLWYSKDQAFVVREEVFGGQTVEQLRRGCTVLTNPQVSINADVVKKLTNLYNIWWDEERFGANSVEIPVAGTRKKEDFRHAVQTNFGSRRGCAMRIEFDGWVTILNPKAVFHLAESGIGKCDRPSFGSGKIPVHRLPQITK